MIVSYNRSVDLAPHRPSVAVFGGDRTDAGYGPEVALFPGTERDKKRLCASLRQGSFRYLVLMTKWMSHNQRDAAREAAAGRAHVVYWNRGHGALGEYLTSLLRGTATTPGEAMSADAAPPSAEEAARNAGFTVACFEAQHDACEYRDAAQVRCGCACHPLVTEEPEVSQLEARSAEGAASAVTSSPATSRAESEPEVKQPVQPAPGEKPPRAPRAVPTARFDCSPKAVLEALSVDPQRHWTVSDIAYLLLAKTSTQVMSVHRCVTSMLKQGALALAQAGDGTKKNPRKVTLPSAAPAAAPAPASRPAALPPTPQAGCHYLVLDEFSRVLLSTHDKSAVLTCLEGHAGARLFKELRTRVRIEIEES